ncbi:unnamed protein product [Caretta caretta]
MEEIHFKEELEVTEYLADKKLEAIPCIVGSGCCSWSEEEEGQITISKKLEMVAKGMEREQLSKLEWI